MTDLNSYRGTEMTPLAHIKFLLQSGDVVGAEALCRKALESDPGNGMLKFYHDLCLSRLRKLNGVIGPAATRKAEEPAEPETLRTVELPPPQPPPAKPGERKPALTRVTGKGCLRMLLWTLGGLAALFLVIIAVAYFSAKGEEKMERLPYLWTSAENGHDFLGSDHAPMSEYLVNRGNFAISVFPEFQDPEEVEFDPSWPGIDLCRHWTFMSSSSDARVDVSYLRKKPGESFYERESLGIAPFNNSFIPAIEFGIGPFVAVLGEGLDVMERGKPDCSDWAFARKHGARGFSSCHGLLRKNGMRYRLFQVTIVREREAWRIQTLMPSALERTEDVSKAGAIDQLIAGDMIGRFRVLGVDAAETNAENKAEKAIRFLHAVPSFGGAEGSERRIEEANFSVMLSPTWDKFATYVPDSLPQGFARHQQYRFMGPGETQWLYVEYMRLSSRPVDPGIASWVDAMIQLTGKPDLFPPENVGMDFDVLSMERIPFDDVSFMRRHNASQMCAYKGTILIGGTHHRVFMFCIGRGHEAWKVAAVFPTQIKEGAPLEEAIEPSSSDIAIGALFLGNFSILPENRLNPDSAPDGSAVPPRLGEAPFDMAEKPNCL